MTTRAKSRILNIVRFEELGYTIEVVVQALDEVEARKVALEKVDNMAAPTFEWIEIEML